MTWVTKLEDLLRDHNKSKVSKACGWTPQRISNMLAGEQVPNAIDAVTLCRYLNVSVEDIFGDDAGWPIKPDRRADAAEERALREELARGRAGKRRTG